jgi:hypothetical protein
LSAELELPPILQIFEDELARAMRQAGRAPTRRRRVRPVLGALASVAAATAVVLGVVLVRTGGDATVNAMADPLLRAASAALRQPSLFPRSDQYLYIRTEGRVPAGMSTRQGRSVTAVERVITDTWMSAGRPTLRRTRVVAVQFSSRADAKLWRENHGVRAGTTSTMHGPPLRYYLVFTLGRHGELNRREVRELPSNPRKLLAATVSFARGGRAWLASLPGAAGTPTTQTSYTYTYSTETAAAVGLPGAEERTLHNGFLYASLAFGSIAEDFEQGTLPARVRSGLYRALALIPGVRYLGVRRDLVGRPGAEVVFEDLQHDIREELIFDPATSALLGEREVLTSPNAGFAKGTPLEDVAFLNEAVTDTPTIPAKRTDIR